MSSGKGGFSAAVVESWWGSIGCGLACFVLAAWMNSDFKKLESGETKTLYVNSLVKTLYDIGGRTGVCGTLIFFGVALIGWGIFLLAQSKS